MSIDIQEIRKFNYRKKIENEIEFLSNSDLNLSMFNNKDDIVIDNRIDYLKYLINETNEKTIAADTVTDKQKIINHISKYVYKKHWNKLYKYHKIEKIKEYINEIVQNENLKNNIIKSLTKYITDGYLNNTNSVVYDPNREKILKMPCLNIDYKNNIYNINIK